LVVLVPSTSALPSLAPPSRKSATLSAPNSSWQAARPAEPVSAFALRLLQRRFDEAEGRRVDFVLDPFVVDVGGVGQQHEPAFEVDVTAIDGALRLRVHVELGQAARTFALEGAGEADVDFAAFGAPRVDAEREVDVAAFDPLQGRVFDHGLRTLVALVAAAPAGGEEGGRRDQGGHGG
jgi:hypothetical protein